MKKWILITLLAQLLFFMGWGISESLKLSGGREAHGEFLLETVPVDPRDFLAGQYMDLRLKISDASALLPHDSDRRQSAAVLIQPQGEAVIGRVPYKVYGAVRALRPAADPLPQAGPGQLWAKAASGPSGRLVFGIERYYFGEDRTHEMNTLRSGKFYARVVLAPDGTLKLLGLEKP